MELRQLRYFIVVAEYLNFTEASKRLFVAQSAVSQQIAKLEQQVGVKLFTRNKRSVQLTSAGKAFLKEAIEIVRKTEEAIEKTHKANIGILGSLKTGFLAAPVRKFLPSLIRHFNNKYPMVDIELHHLNLAQLNEKLNADDLDIVFTVSFAVPQFGDYECKKLFSESICVFLHPEHSMCQKPGLRIADLAMEPFILRDREEGPQWYEYILMTCAKNGFLPKIARETRHIETVLMFVEAGLGITILPRYLEMYANPSIRIIEVEDEKDSFDVVVYRKKRNMNPSVPLFLNEMDHFVHREVEPPLSG
ncbi:MAG TPA: LysR family transcriptional regulator [Alicyclobacillus sp.]|nr:LysR family transcriptional regulator [Alicyclobacillus sp.]